MSINVEDEVELQGPKPETEHNAVNPVMTLIIAAGQPDAALGDKVKQFQRATRAELTEVVVACEGLWPESPPGVRVVVTGHVSRGDRLDLASEAARGELLAFVDQDVSLSPDWQQRAIELMRTPSIGAAGGPHALPSGSSSGQRAAWTVLSSGLGSGPRAYRFRTKKTRDVPEVSTTNLIVRKRAFLAVGGFQSPSPLGDGARLCYKLRALLGLRIVCDPSLRVETAPPALPQPCLRLVTEWGRHRGDMRRRLPEASGGLVNQIPALTLLCLALLGALSTFFSPARIGLALAAGTCALAASWMVIRSRHLASGLLAGLCLPLVHGAYALGFLRGYLGRSVGEIAPGRFRSTPLRILVFNWRDITHPWSGGAEIYMHELSRRWVQAGCEVGWVSERYRTGKSVETIDGIRFHRVGGQFTVYAFAALAYLLRLRKRYDVIVDCENGIPFFTPLFSRKPSLLVVYHLHRDVFRRELPIYLRWLAFWLEGWLMPRVYRNRELVTISESTHDDLIGQGYNPMRILVVKSGVDVAEGAYSKPFSAVPLLVYLGRLKRYKSVDVLLRAMPEVLGQFPNARLAIVGQGPEREGLERLSWNLGLAEHVRFHGYLPNALRDGLLAEAWIAICPSQFEGWGVVCLEANAHGTPVVAASVPGLKDSVVDGVTGMLFPHGDSQALAQQLIALMGDDSRRKSMVQPARAWAASHNWDRSAATFLGKLSEIAYRPGQKRRTSSVAAPNRPGDGARASQ